MTPPRPTANPPPAPETGTEWWKWTAAALAAFIIGLMPFIIASRTLVQQVDFEHVRQTQIEVLERLASIEAHLETLDAQIAGLEGELALLRADLDAHELADDAFFRSLGGVGAPGIERTVP